jgi:hypothetical protein
MLNRVPSLVALCIDCNYPVAGIPTSRCPECGRPFDITDGSTFNSGRRLNRFDRYLLAPIGQTSFGIAAGPCLLLLYLSLSSQIYYTPIQYMLMTILWVGIAVMLAVRTALRHSIPPPLIPRAPDRHGVIVVLTMVAATCLLVAFQVPLRLVFLTARPSMDALIADIQSGKTTLPISGSRAGPMTVWSTGYGDENEGVLFFQYHLAGMEGGIAYCPKEGPRGYYNEGNDGWLAGHWHWWVDD